MKRDPFSNQRTLICPPFLEEVRVPRVGVVVAEVGMVVAEVGGGGVEGGVVEWGGGWRGGGG